MEIRILGAHNLESATSRLSSLVVDGVLALDAGSLTSGLTLEEQARIKAVLLTHHHFDHVRDLATLGLGTWSSGTIDVFAPQAVLDVVASHLMDGTIYPDFTLRPSPEKPSLRLWPLDTGKTTEVAGYAVTPVPVPHSAPCTGYLFSDARGSPDSSGFYTGDTGPGLASACSGLRPGLLITEVTLTDAQQDDALRTGHLTPSLLKVELAVLRQSWGYLPPVIILHMSPPLEREIVQALAQIARELRADIRTAYRDMRVSV
ncbi:MAG: lactamase [Chloroflexi bacterium]|nr:lactamase [Chloroflexota bacterium]